MSGGDLERVILGTLRAAPRLFEASDLTANDFPDGKLRNTFGALSQIWEESRPSEIDSVLLIQKLGGNGVSTFISSLIDGAVRLDPETYRARVAELRKQNITRQIIKTIEHQGRTGEFDLEEIRVSLLEYENLKHPAELIRPISSVESKTIAWLWPSRIPLGMLSLLAGSPGHGKSTLALAIAAILTRGKSLPDSGECTLECDSLILAAEDSIPHVVRPRAEANGADLSKIFFLDSEELDTGKISRCLQRALTENPRIKFIIIDPLNSFLQAGTDYFRDPDVRRSLLRPLASVAEEYGAAVLGIVHLNKKTDESNALNRIGGSVAYGAAARSVLALGLDPDDEERRFLAPVKCNYSKPPGTVAFNIEEGGRVEFEMYPLNIDADEILQPRNSWLAAEADFAKGWLIDKLRSGPVVLKDLLQAALKDKIGRTTIFRVRKKIGVISKVTGFGSYKVSTWELQK